MPDRRMSRGFLLHGFNERVERIERCRLTTRMQDPNYRLDYNRMVDGHWVTADGVDEDDIDSFILNVRCLIQDNDTSIRKLARTVYSDIAIPDHLRSEFGRKRTEWRQFCNKPTPISPSSDHNRMTFGQIWDTLIYGGIAHSDPKKAQLFRLLTKQGALSSFVCFYFLIAMKEFYDLVKRIRDINIQVLEHQLETDDSASTPADSQGRSPETAVSSATQTPTQPT